MVKVSVIVPIYNKDSFVKECLDSLLEQTFEDLEIICVDDNSSDNSLDILKEYSNKDKRIKIIECHQNSGPSKARNIGIDSAEGEYLGFVDADDKVEKNFVETLYLKAKETNADIAKAIEVDVSIDNKQIVKRPYPYVKNPLYFFTGWWSAIYRKSLIIDNNIRFPEGVSLGEDLKFLFDATRVCNKVVGVNNTHYYYTERENSLDGKLPSVDKIKDVIEVFSYILDKMDESEIYKQDKDVYVLRYATLLTHIVERHEKSGDPSIKELCSIFINEFINKFKYKDEYLEKMPKIYSFITKK